MSSRFFPFDQRLVCAVVVYSCFQYTVRSDEYAESLAKNVAEQCLGIRRFELHIKEFKGTVPHDPPLIATTPVDDERCEYRIWIDRDEEVGVVVRRRTYEKAFGSKRFEGTQLTFTSYRDKTVRSRQTLTGEVKVSQLQTKTSTFDSFQGDFPPVELLPFGRRGLASNTTVQQQLDKVFLFFREHATTRRLPDGVTLVEWTLPDNPTFRGKTSFSASTGMVIERTLSKEVDGKRITTAHEALGYEERDGLFVPIALTYEQTFEKRFSGQDAPILADCVGTIELEWMQANPDTLKIPDVETLLKNFPRSTDVYFERKDAIR